jgi:alpha-L-fucosidase
MAGTTNWNSLDTDGFEPGSQAPATDTLNAGNIRGKYWIPAECDVSIRPGWFYHAAEDTLVKSPEKLFELYLKSVGRGSNLLLNVPPDGRGLITRFDAAALMGFKHLRDVNFARDLSRQATISLVDGDSIMNRGRLSLRNNGKSFNISHYPGEFIQLHFKKPTWINCLVLKENITGGQAVQKFYIQLRNRHSLVSYMYTTIGHKRILTFPGFEAEDMMIHFLEGRGEINISATEAYFIQPNLVEK